MEVDCVPIQNGKRGSQDDCSQAGPQMILSNLHIHPRPGIDTNPYFSWILSSSNASLSQVSYQVLLSRYRAGASDMWNSGIVYSPEPPLARYTGPSLASHTHYFWTVRVETTGGLVIGSSQFKTGRLMSPGLTIQKRDAIDLLAVAFKNSSWIWTLEENTPLAPGEDRAFRRTYTPPPNTSSVFAEVIMTADDRFSLYIDGTYVGGSPPNNDEFGWRAAQRFNVSLNSSSSTVFAVRGTNFLDVNTGGETAAGLLTAIKITHSDGSDATLTSDSSWRVTKIIPASFEQPSVNDTLWSAANVYAKYTTSPWFDEVNIPTAPTQVTPSSTPMSAGSTTVTSSTGVATSTSAVKTSTTNLAGPIAGGVIAGIAIFSLVVVLFLFWKRSRHCRSKYSSSTSSIADSSIYYPPSIQQIEPFVLQAPTVLASKSSQDDQPSHGLSTNLGRSFSGRQVASSSTTEVRQEVDGRIYTTNSIGNSDVTRNRVQRLQDLVSELNRAVSERGEGGQYVSELRGRIAELIREDSETELEMRAVILPPAYQSPRIHGHNV